MNILGKIFGSLDKTGFYWYRMPKPLAILNLTVLRKKLRRRNMFDAYIALDSAGRPSASVNGEPETAPQDAASLIFYRTANGTHNNLKCPFVGMSGTRFWPQFPA